MSAHKVQSGSDAQNTLELRFGPQLRAPYWAFEFKTRALGENGEFRFHLGKQSE